MAEENTENNGEGALDLSALGSFDFTPDWAKGRPDDTSKYARFESREERGDRGDRGERARFPQGGQRRDDHGGGRRFPQGGQRRDERGGGDRPRRDDRPRFQRGGERPQRPFVKPLDVDVRILPEQRQLGDFIRKIQSAPYMAYPLKQLAYFFLAHPEACVLRVSPKKDAEPISFHQCKACGFVAFSEDELMAHVVAAHLGDYYDCEEVECEPPKGTFSCVARCGLSGELLGPPNLHGYDARVREMLRTRYPDMDESAYRARIEMVRDPEVVEQWRKSATKKTIYRRKGPQAAEPAAEGEAPAEVPAVEREMAELEFRRLFAPALLTTPRTVDITADKALKSSNLGLVFACRDAIQREKRFPSSLFFALRGAFHHRKLQFFRANDQRGPEFVIAVKPSALDTAHAIPELAELVKYVENHLDVSPGAVTAALSGGDPEKAKVAKAHIMWLLEKGHLVCYANGGLVSPAEHPYWRPRQNRPEQPKPAAAVSTPEAPKPETSEPAPTEPEASKPETSEPAPTEPETPKPETSEPAPTEPETPKPETSEPLS